MKVAIVHYWLINMRGGEKMLEALLELFPQADIWTHVYKPGAVSEAIRRHKVFTTYINKLPFVSKLYPVYMPLMPAALLDCNMQEYDLIISSEAGPAKGVVPAPGAYHLCYCHSPMRYIWDMYHEYRRSAGVLTRAVMRLLTPRLRLWDIASANLVDRFITNSNYTALRIRRYYQREAAVVFGPADTKAYVGVARNPQDYYLFFGQVTYNKRVDIALDACLALNKKLLVAGAVSDKKLIAAYKNKPGITFTGRITQEALQTYLSEAKALLFPGIEDMGLVPVEAQAAGCPVIAFRAGGVLDTVCDGKTGLFFDEQTPGSLAQAIRRFESIEGSFADRRVFNEQAAGFSKEAFLERVRAIIAERKRL